VDEKVYNIINGFLDEDYCKAFTTYALRERFENFIPYSTKKHLYPGDETHAGYMDSFTEASLRAMLEKVQRNFPDKEIFPSYSFYIVYENGARLSQHIDKTECEISITVPTGYLYGDSYEGSVWPLYMDDNSIKLNIGDALLYTQHPKKLKHWREPFEGVYQVQLLLHYITQSGKKSAPVPKKTSLLAA